MKASRFDDRRTRKDRNIPSDISLLIQLHSILIDINHFCDNITYELMILYCRWLYKLRKYGFGVWTSLESMAVLEKIFRVHDQLLPGAPGAKAIETQLRVHRVHKTGWWAWVHNTGCSGTHELIWFILPNVVSRLMKTVSWMIINKNVFCHCSWKV